jgi:hypothetical protein
MKEYLVALWAKCCDYAKKGSASFCKITNWFWSTTIRPMACGVWCKIKTCGVSCCTAVGTFMAWVMSFFVSSVHNVMDYTEGSVVLGFGKHEIQIQCDDCPSKVNVAIQEPCDGVPVCQGGDVNSIGVKILADGFILVADIKSNTCCVEWFCEF